MANKKNRNEIRKENYKKLRDAGYSSKDANRLKSQGKENIKKLVKEKRAEIRKQIQRELYYEARKKGYSSKEAKTISKFGKQKRELFQSMEIGPGNKQTVLEYIKSQSPRLVIPPFIPVEEYRKQYLEPFSYLVRYAHKDGTFDYITITSLTKLNAAELQEIAHQYFDEGKEKNIEKYKAVPILYNSLFVEAAVYNQAAYESVRK